MFWIFKLSIFKLKLMYFYLCYMFDSVSFRNMIKRGLTSKDFKAEDTNTPQIKFKPICLAGYKFRWGIIESATNSISPIWTNNRRTKITQLIYSLNRLNQLHNWQQYFLAWYLDALCCENECSLRHIEVS